MSSLYSSLCSVRNLRRKIGFMSVKEAFEKLKLSSARNMSTSEICFWGSGSSKWLGLNCASATGSHITRSSATKSADVALATSDRRLSRPGFQASSASSKAIQPAFASRKPTLRAAAGPPLTGVERRRMDGISRLSALTTSTVSSVEQSSMTRISSGGKVCAAALRTARSIMPETLYAGMMTEKSINSPCQLPPPAEGSQVDASIDGSDGIPSRLSQKTAPDAARDADYPLAFQKPACN